ncbi:MAG: velvet factor-domain-containing protein [Benjaminiella poitrasii]|nr:MAG: velvet factor-domain-containing protein [Benjaminiella poitrasii]
MSSVIPPPLGLGRPSQKSKRYKLIMVQNPVRARCCGFGEKDRRPIDPPPILQLFIENPDGSLQNVANSKLSLFVVQCDLYSEDGEKQRGYVYNPSSFVSSTTNQDLSVRIEGRFCLKFMFINLSAGDPLTMSTEIYTTVFSKPFDVYSAKNFPGMTDSTLLSQCFAQQGIKISIRKGRRIQRLVGKEDYTTAVVDQETIVTEEDNDDDKDIKSSSSSSTFNRMHISTFLSPP